MEISVFRMTLVRVVLAAVLMCATPVAAVAQIPAGAAPAKAAAAAAPPAAPAQAAAAPVTPPTSIGQTRSSGDLDYILGVGDSVDVAVVGRTDFGGRARVGSDGNILVQYLGTVPAVGRSPGQLAEMLRIALERGGYFSQPVVRVELMSVASRFVTVLGSVTSPGLISLDRQYRLSEILARVGGRAGNGADYLILTHENGQSQQFKLAELATSTGDKDPMVANGDKVYVPANETQVFYVSGQVKSPGAYPVSEGMTVRMALARAGGVGEQGNEKKVKINRKGENLKGVKLDATTIEPGDILTIGERMF